MPLRDVNTDHTHAHVRALPGPSVCFHNTSVSPEADSRLPAFLPVNKAARQLVHHNRWQRRSNLCVMWYAAAVPWEAHYAHQRAWIAEGNVQAEGAGAIYYCCCCCCASFAFEDSRSCFQHTINYCVWMASILIHLHGRAPGNMRNRSTKTSNFTMVSALVTHLTLDYYHFNYSFYFILFV